MTNREAIETIKIAIAEVEWNYPMEYSVAFDKAIEALDKQTPKKPIYDYRYKPKICPHCHDFLENYQSFCDNCGQKIDWSDEDDV